MHPQSSVPPGALLKRLIVVCLLWLTAVSWLRAGLAGRLDLDAIPFNVPLELTVRLLMAPAVLLIAWAYVRLWHTSRDLAVDRTLLWSGLAMCAASALALPLTSNDVFSNLAYGRMANLGIDVGRFGPDVLPAGDSFRAAVAPRWLDSPCVYGPVSVAIFRLVTFTDRLWLALLEYKLLFAACAALIVVVGYRACLSLLPEARVNRGLVLLVCNPLIAWEIAGQAHNDGAMILFTLAFVVALARGHPWWAGVFLAFAIAAKTAVLPVAFFFALSAVGPLRRRTYVALCAASCAAFVLLWWAYPGLGLPLGYASSAEAAAKRLINSVPALIFTMARLYSDPLAFLTYRVYWLAALLVVASVAMAYGWKTTNRRAVLEYSFRYLLLLTLVFAPNLQPWYFAWFVPLAAFSENRGLHDFLVNSSMAFFALYPVLQTVPAGVTALVVLVILLVRYRRNLGSYLDAPAPPAAALGKEAVT